MSFAPEPALVSLLDCSGNPNYPGDAIAGQQYTVSVAGKIGGSSGKSVNVGDRITCLTANVGGTEASVGTSWVVDNQSLVITASRTMTAAESDGTYFLALTGTFVVTLPSPAIGLRFRFIVSTAPAGTSYTIVTASSANIIKGNQNSVAGDAGDFGTADDTISFVTGSAVAGDKVELFCDGTSWFAYAISKVAAGITFTQAS